MTGSTRASRSTTTPARESRDPSRRRCRGRSPGWRGTTSTSVFEANDAYSVLARPFTLEDGTSGVVVLAEPLAPYEHDERSALAVSVAAGVLMVLLAVVMAAWISRRALAPVQDDGRDRPGVERARPRATLRARRADRRDPRAGPDPRRAARQGRHRDPCRAAAHLRARARAPQPADLDPGHGRADGDAHRPRRAAARRRGRRPGRVPGDGRHHDRAARDRPTAGLRGAGRDDDRRPAGRRRARPAPRPAPRPWTCPRSWSSTHRSRWCCARSLPSSTTRCASRRRSR